MTAALLILSLLLPPVPLRAPPPGALEPAQKAAFLEALRAARAAYDRGECAEAVAAFDRAASLASAAEIHIPRAACLERLGRFDEAAEALRTYLSLAPDARDRGRVEAEIGRLSAASEAARAVPIEITSRPAAAELRLGNAEGPLLGTTPLSTRLPPGSHLVYVQAAGHLPETRRLELRRGEASQVEIVLSPVPLAEPAPDPTLAYVLLGTGAALAVGAGVLGWYTAERIDQANDYDRGDPDHTRGELDDLQASVPTLKTAFYLTAAAAVLSAGAGGGLLAWKF